jgi:pilus assembly protein Flp/PilA
MLTLKRFVSELLNDEEGATALEYGLIVAAVAGVILTVVYLAGGRVNNTISTVATHL